MAKNPYEVLGVSRNASKEEIDKSYRTLIRKYHPDQYTDNPLRKLAEEKLKEINEAYESLKSGNASSTGGSTNNSYSANSRADSASTNAFNQARFCIQRGDLAQAEVLLNSATTRNAEWNFLMGVLNLRRGWSDNAYNYLLTATKMDPTNREYASAFQSLNNRNTQYRTYGAPAAGGASACDMCQCLICTDCCCECMGSDLIACC